jgi:Fe-S cluster biogenesis protein NfuA
VRNIRLQGWCMHCGAATITLSRRQGRIETWVASKNVSEHH